MRKHRFFVTDELEVDKHIILPKDILHQVKRVLRLRNGTTVYFFNNSGFEYEAIIEENKAVITAKIAEADASPVQINLAQVIGKGTKMNLVIQKATELGVTSITPLFSEYSISKETSKLENWQNVAIAASCQCWRNTTPKLNPPIELQDWLNLPLNGTKLIFVPGGEKIDKTKLESNINILIGPEGGFSITETDAAYASGFIASSLGPRILRTETAGIAAIAILQAMAGDM